MLHRFGSTATAAHPYGRQCSAKTGKRADYHHTFGAGSGPGAQVSRSTLPFGTRFGERLRVHFPSRWCCDVASLWNCGDTPHSEWAGPARRSCVDSRIAWDSARDLGAAAIDPSDDSIAPDTAVRAHAVFALHRQKTSAWRLRKGSDGSA